jgi:hypothetical protein
VIENPRHTLLIVAAAALLASCALRATPAAAPASAPASEPAAIEKQTLAYVERLRGVKPATDAKSAEQYNRQLEEAWKFFLANRKAVSLTLRRQLTLELGKTARNDFILLDLGYFLYIHGEPADKEIAKTALFALNPRAEIMRFNQQELFQFAHEVASEGDDRVLPVIDAAFLRQSVTLRIPERGVTLDEKAVCVFLYGALGGAEAHLRRLLADKAVARKVLDVLIWIGSPESNADARSAMAAGDPEVFVRAATFLMTMGGPQGRWLILGLNPKELDARNREYYGKMRKPAEETTFQALRKRFGAPGSMARAGDEEPARMPDEELKKRIAAMNAGYGSDLRVSPAAILDSGLPREFLIEQLTRTRGVLLRRPTPEVAADVQRTNALINALRYREK